MIPRFREEFNRNYTVEKYHRLLSELDREVGFHIEFRISETPVFLPLPLVETMISAGREIVDQLLSNPSYLADSDRAVPHKFLVPNETPHPVFVAVDFGITEKDDGSYSPMLIEMQGFPSLFAYQPVLSEAYKRVYAIPEDVRWTLSGLTYSQYEATFRKAVLSNHSPENVVLLELDPERQKTRADFVLTERMLGIRTVNIRDVVVEGNHMFYDLDGKRVPIHRVYNRAIADELERVDAELPFSFRDDIHVEWAGHPNWFFKLSKFSLPYVNHPCVPESFFLSRVDRLPDDLENWVLKPLFSFAGSGVRVSPSMEEIQSIPDDESENYILQRKVDYAGLVKTPHGATKAEVRILYIWLDRPLAVTSLVRMGRGTMMGVDHNKNMEWVGSSAGLFFIV